VPGLNLLASQEPLDHASLANFDRVQQSMLHRSSYAYRPLLRTDHVCLGMTSYSRYPSHVIDKSEFIVGFEGMIYNKTAEDIERELSQIGRDLGSSSKGELEAVRQFVATSDGEFLVVIHVPNQCRVLAFNDSMGRLPSYVHSGPGRFLLSREVKFILPFLESVDLDSAGLMEYLLFGFTFDRNTLIEGVSYLRPRSILSFSTKTGELATHQGAARNFEHTMWPSRKQAVAELRDRFLQAMHARAAAVSGYRAVVSLSGGLDSRGTLAALVSARANAIAITIEGPEKTCAGDVAKALGVEIRVLPVPKEEGDFESVVFLKDGLDCHPDLAHLYDYPQSIEAEFGEDIVYFTGAYGGEITRYRNPTSSLGSTSALVEYLLSAEDNYKYSTDQVCKLLGIHRETVVQHLGDYVTALPEQSPFRKYIHFRNEFDIKYAGEAEDRNRFYFWTISPYFSERFFEYTMSLDENKKDTPLFRDFLYAIDPRTCEVKYFNFNLPMKYRPLLFGLSIAERVVRVPLIKAAARRAIRIKRRVNELLRRDGADPSGVTERLASYRAPMLEIARTSPMVQRHFDLSATEHIVATEQDGQGLERIRIVLAYSKIAEAWHQRFNPRSNSYKP
jgi:asparagine synthase (glutamine-hydrolysing)